MNRKLIQIARRYQQTIQKAYDRICTGVSKNGNRIPRNKVEADRIRYIMKFELDWSKSVAEFDGFKRGEIDKALRAYRRVK